MEDPRDKKELDGTEQTITQQVREILRVEAEHLGIAESDDVQNIHIHVATGALTGKEAKDEIIYPDQTDIPGPSSEENLTSDVALMTVTPVHGTVTFKIDPSYLETLRSNQVSLDDTAWQAPLKEFGWNLVRPPRIRVFYTNDILYIGAEIPHNMNSIKDRAKYEEQVTAYTRQIAELVFPTLKAQIHELPVNEHLRSRFPTARGQRGEVVKIERTDAESSELLHDNVTTFYHGDSRYLPHYQTGSGFITAFLENELYVNVYKQKSIDELLVWLYSQPGTEGIKVDDRYTKEKVIAEFSRDLPEATPPAVREEYALEAFKAETFKQRSLDIIEHNQEKVGRYLNALNTQTLEMLSENCPDLIESFNRHAKRQLQPADYQDVDPKHLGNTAFLREQMPKLLNIDFDPKTVDDAKLLHLRDMLVKDLKFSLMVDDIAAAIPNCDSHTLCRNYEHSSSKTEMRTINSSIKAIDLNISKQEIAMVKAALLDYTKGSDSALWGTWRSIRAILPWTTTHTNIKIAKEIISKIDNEEYASFNDLKKEIIKLDTGKSIGQGALKAAIVGIRDSIAPPEEDRLSPQ